MGNLSNTWLTDRHIDVEFKSYILMAYLETVKEDFDAVKLYPKLAELVGHYNEAIKLKQVAGDIRENFPKTFTGFDLETFRLKYETLLDDDLLFEEVVKTASFAIPKLDEWIREGKRIYDKVEEQLYMEPVGVVPLQAMEGYLLLTDFVTHATEVYEYQVTLFETSTDHYRAIRTEFVTSYPPRITHTFQFIKSDLIKSRKSLPNPATYAVASGMPIPVYECFLPIAKRMLIRKISGEG